MKIDDERFATEAKHLMKHYPSGPWAEDIAKKLGVPGLYFTGDQIAGLLDARRNRHNEVHKRVNIMAGQILFWNTCAQALKMGKRLPEFSRSRIVDDPGVTWEEAAEARGKSVEQIVEEYRKNNEIYWDRVWSELEETGIAGYLWNGMAHNHFKLARRLKLEP